MNARDLALLELDRLPMPGWTGHSLRARIEPLDDARDLALSEQIRIGVIKNLLLLQRLIEHHSGRRLSAIDEPVQKILAIALYQLRFLSRIPASAAVDEAVRQAKRMGQARAAGFINAVLRNATRNPDPTDLPPHVAFSHPQELYERFVSLLGPKQAMELCRRNNAEPPTLVRLFRSATPEQLQSPDVTVTPHEQPGIFVVWPAKRSLLAAWSRFGIAQVQDATAARVVSYMDLSPGQRVLDRCCGVGTKLLQIVEAVGRKGQIVGVDPSGPRLETLKELLHHRGIDNVQLHRVEMLADVPDVWFTLFDRVLVDVPCSNSGVLARRPEARYRQTPAVLESLRRLQREILNDTAPTVRHGGLLVYSTCSIWPEENEQMIDSFLSAHPTFQRLAQHTILPSLGTDQVRWRDGGYIAVLRRM